jgi:hypothetical protein
VLRFLLLPALLCFASAAAAQAPATVQTADEALTQDAAEYARQHEVAPEEAVRRLRAQEATVAITDALAVRYRKRLAGISIEHGPEYRIVVLLTGRKRIADRSVAAGGLSVPIVFRTGAAVTRDRMVEALRERAEAIRAAFPDARGLGADPRTGELVLMLGDGGKDYPDLAPAGARLREIAGVPARVRVIDPPATNLAFEGGARVEGTDSVSGRHEVCTAGFVVTDGSRTGLVTAAHCPDILTYVDPSGSRTELPFVGQWGWSYQDVQVNVAEAARDPLFYVDRGRSIERLAAAQRGRAATRAGDFVCHRGERSGYSCGEVELTDYAPPGALCGGPCAPSWVTVAGPGCGGGDSGGPVFSGNVAFGIVKGGTWDRNGRCAFYYYMSLDYLPEGWSLLTRSAAGPPQPAAEDGNGPLPAPPPAPMSASPGTTGS